jgi:hypothetical protein
MQAAAHELLALGVDGLQLTPGCAPTPQFAEWVRQRANIISTHHGFSLVALRQTVWSDDGRLLARDHSVHPPKATHPAAATFWDTDLHHSAVEVMYPGYILGTGAEVERAMECRLPLCVDISHVYIQMQAGVMTESTRQRLFDYDLIAEVHISANDGRGDQHRQIDMTTYELGWAKDRMIDGTITVFESYLHRLTAGERQRQVDLIRF